MIHKQSKSKLMTRKFSFFISIFPKYFEISMITSVLINISKILLIVSDKSVKRQEATGKFVWQELQEWIEKTCNEAIKEIQFWYSKFIITGFLNINIGYEWWLLAFREFFPESNNFNYVVPNAY